jgi:predicted metal-dependent enzyme (double-stranded beta helix superfamily)
MTTPGLLDRVRLDWTDFAEASRVSREIVQELAADRALLRRLVLGARQNDHLRPLAEQHDVLSYVVLYDALDRGLRVRLHRFPQGLVDTPHNHRFSFSSALLHGSYQHTLFRLEHLDRESPERHRWRLEQPEGTHGAIELEEPEISGLTPLFQTDQAAGSSYSLHHSAIHATAIPLEEAYSVFLRGPAEKVCALQLQPAGRTYRWKFGRGDESEQVLLDRSMTNAQFDGFIDALTEQGLI